MTRHSRTGTRILGFGFLCVTLLVLAACWNDDDDAQPNDASLADSDRPLDPEQVNRVDDLVEFIATSEHEELGEQRVEIDAWVSAPPESNSSSGTPPQGCPVVPDKQSLLSDEPIATQLEIAGATIPNERLAGEVPVLRLVVPYTLGFIEIPERAKLAGYVMHDDYAECPAAESLFILDEIIDPLSADDVAEGSELVQEWEQYTHDRTGVDLEYPAGWEVEERDTGQSLRVRFVGSDNFRVVRLEAQDGETYWHPDASESGIPDVLGGDRQELASVGQAYARLVDDRRRTSDDERELRLVFNHQGHTIFLTMLLRDGAELDSDAIWVFSEMASRISLQGDVDMSDPMDPVLAASDEIGEGPFLSEADAYYVAVNASGMAAAEAVMAELVSEQDARQAVDGACRDFDGRPPGVWLVTVDGVTPSGRDVYRLVYLDASTGDRLCQTEAPGVS